MSAPPVTAARPSIVTAFRRNRFLALLASLALMLLATPFSEEFAVGKLPNVAEITITVTLTIMLLTAVAAVSEDRVAVIVAGILVAAGIATRVAQYLTPHPAVGLAHAGLVMLFIGYTTVVILRHLFAVERVTVNVIAASLCVYLLLGVFWGQIYGVMDLLSPASFQSLHVAGAIDEQGAIFRRGTLALYYSFVTLTTLGYGDIVPETMPARMVAAMEAVTGQIYMVVLVARLVGLHIVHSQSGRS